MPFDLAIARGRASGVPATRSRRAVSVWLFLICFMLLGMIALGGATRLTGSGLSIMEWAPISGILPPLTHQAWEHLFALYKQIPQYKLEHSGFGTADLRRELQHSLDACGHGKVGECRVIEALAERSAA